jgi:hypothetical protein
MNNPFHRSQRIEPVQLLVQSNSSRLKDIVANNQGLYFAMQNFLIISPERQVPLLDGVGILVAKGDAAKSVGKNLEARADYETAARIEIFRQNKESARNCLKLADGVSEDASQHHEFHETMLADMDEVLRVSKAFQNSASN